MELKITESNGWSKLVDINKAITRIGSAPSGDIQLSSNSIAPVHLQILSDPQLPTGCRVVNIASPLEIKCKGASRNFPPYAIYDVRNGDEIHLGEYWLAFSLPLFSKKQSNSKNIDGSLVFNDTYLQPDLALDGRLLVKNTGSVNECQFQVELSGFPQDCYRIDPVPLLFPGAQEEVRIRLFHKVTYPEAGQHDLIVTVNAPYSYPGEELVIRQGIYVAPVVKQGIEIHDDMAEAAIPVNQATAINRPALSPIDDGNDDNNSDDTVANPVSQKGRNPIVFPTFLDSQPSQQGLIHEEEHSEIDTPAPIDSTLGRTVETAEILPFTEPHP